MEPRNFWVLLTCTILFAHANCGDDSNNEDENGNEGENTQTEQDQVPQAVCGVSPYEWLPAEEMGDVLEIKEMVQFSLSKEAIEDLLKDNDYEGIVTIKYGAQVYQFRYVTQDKGKKVEATGVISFPEISRRDSLAAPYILWLHGTSGFMDDCAPSRLGEDAGVPAILMASQGYISVEPDYIGMNGFGETSTMFHPYLVGEATAVASLDALRAADKFFKRDDILTTVKPNNKVIIWGGSQGGHATFFSNLYAPYYAPNYDILAAVALVPPTNLIGHAEAAVKAFGPATLTLGAALSAMSKWYGHLDELDEVITDKEPYHLAQLLPELMDTTCSVDESKYEIDTVEDVYTPDFIEKASASKWDELEPWHCMLAENSLETTPVKVKKQTPFLFVVSANDELVNPDVERKGFETLCDMGYEMDYIECENAKHTEGAVWSLKEQFEWVENQLAGGSLYAPCVRHDAVCCSGSPEEACKQPE